MSKEISSFRNKGKNDLHAQLSQTNDYSKSSLGTSLVPPTLDSIGGISELVETEFGMVNRRFPKRMEIYTQILRLQKNGYTLNEAQRNQISRWLQILNGLDTYIDAHHTEKINRTLYDQQMTMFEAIRDGLEQGYINCSIKAPPGIGKTVLFTELLESTLGNNPSLKALIFVPSLDIQNQTVEKLNQYATELGVGVVNKGKKIYEEQVTVMTYQSLVADMKSKRINPADYDLLILDEEHRSVGVQTQEALKHFSKAIKIGLSATPVDYEGRHEVHRMSVIEAVEEGLLADFTVRWVKTQTQLPALTKSGEYPEEELQKAIDTTARNKAAIEIYKSHQDTPTVIYCQSVLHAQHLARQFEEEGIPAAAIWGNMDKEPGTKMSRKETREAFRNGKIKVICNQKAWREGVDEPFIKVVIRMAPEKSLVNAEQEGGRATRLYKGQEAFIYEFIDKPHEGDIGPASFAEAVNTAQAYAKKDTHSSSGSNGTKPKSPLIDIPGIEVIVDVNEIMRIANENRKKREKFKIEIPEGFVVIPSRLFMDKYNIPHTTYWDLLNKFYNQYPQDYLGGGTGHESYSTVEGLSRFENALKELQGNRKVKVDLKNIPEGFIVMPTMDLFNRSGISIRAFYKVLRKIGEQFPEDFIITSGPSQNYATLVGIAKLEAEITRLKQDGFLVEKEERNTTDNSRYTIPIKPNVFKLELHVGMRTVKNGLQWLISNYPDEISEKEVGLPYRVSTEGYRLLRAYLLQKDVPDPKNIPQGYVELHSRVLIEEYDIKQRHYRKILSEFVSENPEDIITRVGYSHLISENGLKKLKEKLSQIK